MRWISLLLFIPCLAFGQNKEWTQEEKYWATGMVVAQTLDWATTRNLARRIQRHEPYHEINPIIGRYPTVGRVDKYFMLYMPLSLIVADNLGQYRLPMLKTIAGVHLLAVGNNLHLGLRLEF